MPTINHPVEPEELMAYLDGELPVNRAAAAAAHLEHCRDCQILAADLRRLGQELMEWQVEPAPSALAPPVQPEFAQRPKVAKRPLRVWGLAGVAGLIVLVMIIPQPTRRNSKAQMFTTESRPQMAPSDDMVPWTDELRAAMEKVYSNGLLQAPTAPVPAQEAAGQIEPAAPMIVRTAHLTLATTQFDQARTGLDAILKEHHGYYGELDIVSAENTGRTLKTTLRIPSARLDSSITELKKLGRAENELQTGEEVTTQYVDLEARLNNARNTELRLTGLLRERTGKLSDVLSVEVEIGRVRGEIDRMEAERKKLSNRVIFATLTVTINEGYKASTGGKFRNAAAEGYRIMADGVIDAILFVISYGPSALLLAGLLFLSWRLVWKRVRP